MKTHPHSRSVSARCRSQATGAFTLTEVMVAAAIFILAIAGVIACNMFGMQLFELSKAKMGASDDARQAISMMVSEIRSCTFDRVGNFNGSNFVEAGVNTVQQGNAVQVEITTNTNSFIWYYWATNASGNKSLNRKANDSSRVMIIANAVSNNVVFTSEDFDGTPQTNNMNNRVINMKLQFYQLENPNVPIGPGGLFDYYQLNTKITRRR
jgi:type II secretory pathway pseudopilin PulG